MRQAQGAPRRRPTRPGRAGRNQKLLLASASVSDRLESVPVARGRRAASDRERSQIAADRLPEVVATAEAWGRRQSVRASWKDFGATRQDDMISRVISLGAMEFRNAVEIEVGDGSPDPLRSRFGTLPDRSTSVLKSVKTAFFLAV